MDAQMIERLRSLLDAPEADEGVLGEVESWGSEGLQFLLGIALGTVSAATASQRARATYIVGQLGDEASVGPVSELLDDTDEAVRLNAVYALRDLGGDSAARALLRLVRDEQRSVAEKAHTLRALGEIGDETTAEEIGDWLSETRPHDLQLRAHETLLRLRRNIPGTRPRHD